MLDKILRPHYQSILIDPIIPFLNKKITPFSITLFSGISGLCFIPLILLNKPFAAVFFLLFSGYLDTLDGSVARYNKKDSDFGAAMDIIVDRIVEFSAIFGLYLYAANTRALLSILMLGSILVCITSFLVVGIFTQNSTSKSFHYSSGLMERAEAFIFFSLMALLPNYFNFLATLFCFLVCLTAAIRVVEFKKQSELFL